MEEKAIRDCIESRSITNSGLYYRIDENTHLAVECWDYFWFGVKCKKKDALHVYVRLKEALADIKGSETPDDTAPWWKKVRNLPAWEPHEEFHLRRNSNVPSLEFLSGNEEDRAEVVQGIADLLARLWEKIKEHEIADRQNTLPSG